MESNEIKLKCVLPPAPDTERGYKTSFAINKQGTLLAYPRGNLAIVRRCKNLAETFVYKEHLGKVTALGFAPNGRVLASGDAKGQLRTWEIDEPTFTLYPRKEFQLFTGPIHDIAWTEDSQKIAVAGESKDRFVKTINAETGTNVGEMLFHSRPVMCLDVRQSRPYKIVAGSEDQNLSFYNGPPFKFAKALKEHSNYINDVKFSPSGEFIVSAGADRKLLVYSGKEADFLFELKDTDESKNHSKGPMCLFFINDKLLISCSNDGTCKIWDIQEKKVISTLKGTGTSVKDMLVGCLYFESTVLAIALSGYILRWNVDINELKETYEADEVLKGHRGKIGKMILKNGNIVSGDLEGYLYEWKENIPNQVDLTWKEVPESGLVDMQLNHNEEILHTFSQDNTLRAIDLQKKESLWTLTTDGYLKKISTSQVETDVIYALFQEGEIGKYSNGKLLWKKEIDKSFGHPTCIYCLDAKNILLLGTKTGNIVILKIEGEELVPDTPLHKFDFPITSLHLNKEGTILASTDAFRYLTLWDINERKMIGDVRAHTTETCECAWSPDSKYIATCCLDFSVYIWGVEDNSKRVIERAHAGVAVNARFEDNSTLVTAGQDSTLLKWTINQLDQCQPSLSISINE